MKALSSASDESAVTVIEMWIAVGVAAEGADMEGFAEGLVTVGVDFGGRGGVEGT